MISKNHWTDKMVIIYIGSLNPHSNSYRRFKTLESVGHQVTGIDIDKYIYGSIFEKFHHHLNIGPGVNNLPKDFINY